MPTKKQLESGAIYKGIMEELKIRYTSIEYALNGRTGLRGYAVREFCFLELRMMCELIALGCLVAHGDITKANRLRKKYAADEIMNELERLHPHFYPQPVKEIAVIPGKSVSVEAIKTDFPKADLLKLYGKCGGVLHRGSLKNLISFKPPTATSFPDILNYTQKIVSLLNLHMLFLRDGYSIICSLSAGPERIVQVAIRERPADFTG